MRGWAHAHKSTRTDSTRVLVLYDVKQVQQIQQVLWQNLSNKLLMHLLRAKWVTLSVMHR